MTIEPFIKLSKESVTASNDELWIYSVIKGFNTDYKVAEVNINMLKRYTGINSKEKLVSILNELINKRKIKIYEDMQCKVPILIISEEIKPNQSLYVHVKECEEKSFIIIYYSEIMKIMCSNYSVEKSGLFKQFVSIIDRINAKPEMYLQISFPTLDELSERVGKTVSTVKKYNKYLEEMGLIYSKLYMIKKEIKRKIYSRYKYKQDVEEAIKRAMQSTLRRISTKRIKKPELELNKNNEVVIKKQNNNLNNRNILSLSEVLKKDLEKLHCEINNTVIDTISKSVNNYGEQTVRKYMGRIFSNGTNSLNNPTGLLVKKIQDGKSELEAIANKLKNEEEQIKKEQLKFLEEQRFKDENNIKSINELWENKVKEEEYKEYLKSSYNGGFDEYRNFRKQQRLDKHREEEKEGVVEFKNGFDPVQALENYMKELDDVENNL